MIKKIKFIDLGLSSKILWGDKNLGSNSVHSPGLYYQWGDLRGYSKSQIESGLKIFDWEHYRFIKDDNKLIKYSYSDKLRILQPEDDVVTMTLGKNYRIPRKRDFEELIEYTKQSYNKNYIIFKSKINKNQIIFHLPGYAYDSYVFNVGNHGCIWSSSIYRGNLINALELVNKGNAIIGGYNHCYGFVIRPVCFKEEN